MGTCMLTWSQICAGFFYITNDVADHHHHGFSILLITYSECLNLNITPTLVLLGTLHVNGWVDGVTV